MATVRFANADRRCDADTVNSVAIGGDGEIAVGGADGKVYFLAADGARAGEVAACHGR